MKLFNTCSAVIFTFIFKKDCRTDASRVIGESGRHIHNDEKILNLHIVPHTHDDVGWLKTVEQYYYGLNETIQEACVHCILDSVIYALQLDSKRKFTYVEMAFFIMWWDEQSMETKKIVKNLVKNGQLSFVNGGYCMHDEATTHFIGMIDQTTLGHSFLKSELDFIPKIGWQLDPFGHSSTQASLLTSEAGFNALYFGRIDYQDLKQRQNTQNCEGIWDASANNGDKIFWGLTGSFSGNYGAPDGFCFDLLCKDDTPLYGMKDEMLQERVKDFLMSVKLQAERSRGHNVMLTMGSDFEYSAANHNFRSLDILIDTINNNPGMKSVVSTLFPEFDGVHAFYSTPDIYTEYKYNEFTTLRDSDNRVDNVGRSVSIGNLEVKTDDFFPYSDCENCFWTGYFTSRPALKRLERFGSSLLQAARQIQALYPLSEVISNGEKELSVLERSVSIAQHHDGVSGTSKQHVAYDYAKKISMGISQVGSYLESWLKYLLRDLPVVDMKFCQLRNESVCEISQKASELDNDFYIVIYNALAWERRETVSVPVNIIADYAVQVRRNETWHHIEGALVPNYNYAQIQEAAPYNLMIEVDIGPLSAALFRVKSMTAEDELPNTKVKVFGSNWQPQEGIEIVRNLRSKDIEHEISLHDFVVENDRMKVYFECGMISKIVMDDLEMDVLAEWGYYTSFDGDGQDSGAYIFRPAMPDQELKILKPIPSSIKIIENKLVQEIHVSFGWIQQVVKIYRGKYYVDVEYTVDNIPIHDQIGKEIVHRLRSNIKSNSTFYTDSNGREFQKRQRSKRQSWDFIEFEPISGNYYPVNTAIFIEDTGKASLTVLTDRSQGGSSLKDGSIELMVHRRTLKDDGRGVGEALNETESIHANEPYGDGSRIGDALAITGSHRIVIADGSGASAARAQMDAMFSPLLLFAGNSDHRVENYSETEELPVHLLSDYLLPNNVQLLTVKLLSTNSNGSSRLLIRLGHAYGQGESIQLSNDVEVDLSKLVSNIVLISEKTLTGNQDKNVWDRNKMLWGNNVERADNKRSHEEDSPIVTLHPMQIRTFEITRVS